MSSALKIVRMPTPNYHIGRSGRNVLGIVIHSEEGNEAGTDSWFASKTSTVSAHYSVDKSGQIRQFVSEGDTAFHAGIVDNPTAALVRERPGINPNLYLIGIEHEGSGAEDLTPAQRKASVQLVAEIAERWRIPIDRLHILRHHEIRAGKTCPNKIDVDRIVALAAFAVANGDSSASSSTLISTLTFKGDRTMLPSSTQDALNSLDSAVSRILNTLPAAPDGSLGLSATDLSELNDRINAASAALSGSGSDAASSPSDVIAPSLPFRRDPLPSAPPAVAQSNDPNDRSVLPINGTTANAGLPKSDNTNTTASDSPPLISPNNVTGAIPANTGVTDMLRGFGSAAEAFGEHVAINAVGQLINRITGNPINPATGRDQHPVTGEDLPPSGAVNR